MYDHEHCGRVEIIFDIFPVPVTVMHRLHHNFHLRTTCRLFKQLRFQRITTLPDFLTICIRKNLVVCARPTMHIDVPALLCMWVNITGFLLVERSPLCSGRVWNAADAVVASPRTTATEKPSAISCYSELRQVPRGPSLDALSFLVPCRCTNQNTYERYGPCACGGDGQ